jgi:Gpi18-like mannosyltransferase
MTDILRQFDRPRALRCLALAAAILAINMLPLIGYHQGDADRYFIPWYEHIVAAGRLRAFAHPFSNYTPTYLYLLSAASLLNGWFEPLIVIKLLASLGAAWMAYSIGRLLGTLGVKLAFEGALCSLLLPSVVLNVSVFGQSDTFWVAACLLAIVAAVETRVGAVAFWSGVAVAFKAQAFFLAPFVWWLFLTRKAPWWCWLLPPGIYVIAMLPAWSAGWPAWELLTVYLRQAQWQPELGDIFISNGASWWTLYGYYFPQLALGTFWIGYVTTGIAVALYIAALSRRILTPRLMLAAAALSSVAVPFLLPGMHERFFMLADITAYCLAIADPKRSTIASAVLMQLASAIPGYGWALGLVRLELAACFFSLGAIILLIEYESGAIAKPSMSTAPSMAPVR